MPKQEPQRYWMATYRTDDRGTWQKLDTETNEWGMIEFAEVPDDIWRLHYQHPWYYYTDRKQETDQYGFWITP